MTSVREALALCLTHPGLAAAVVHRRYHDVREISYPQMIACRPELAGGAWRNMRHELAFPNGSTFALRYATDYGDVQRFAGRSYQLLLVAPEVDADVVAFLRSRLRSFADSGVPVLGLRTLTEVDD